MAVFSRTGSFIWILTALAASAAILSVAALGPDPNAWVLVLVISITVAILDAFPIGPLLGHVELTISDMVKFATILLCPVPVAILGAALGTFLGEIRFKRPWYRKLFNIAEITLTWVVVAGVYHVFHQPEADYFGSLQNILALVLAGLVDFGINSLFVALVISLAYRQPVSYVWSRNFSPVVWPSLGTLSLGVLLAVLWRYNPLTLLLAILPVLAMRQSLEMANHLQRQTRDALLALMQVIDERDQHTFDHSSSVSRIARSIAVELDLPLEEIETIASAALLHDLGKVGMADGILFSPRRLSPEERKTAERHAEIGAMLLSKFPLFQKGAILVRHHHERFDGKGYPDGLKGEAIPIGARIIAVADSYQAMTEERPYRHALARELAVAELKAMSGSQFDPRVVNAFLASATTQAAEPAPAAGAVPINVQM